MSWREFATRFGLLTESTAGQVFSNVLSKSLTRLNCSNRLSQPDCNWCRLRLLFTFCLLCRGVFGHVFNFLIFWECKAWPSQLTSIHSSAPPRELWASGTKEFFSFLAINEKISEESFWFENKNWCAALTCGSKSEKSEADGQSWGGAGGADK